MDFRSSVLEEEKRGRLQRIKHEINPYLQTTGFISKFEPKSLLFENVNSMSVAANIFSTREKYARYLHIPEDTFLSSLNEKMLHGDSVIEVSDSIYGEAEINPVDLRKLPILTHYSGDGGPYVTSGVWIVNDPQFGVNLSYHRFMIINSTEGTVRVVENRGMHTALKNSAGKAEVAICIGVSPAVLLAAACSPEMDVNEIELAARLDRIVLQRCKTVDLNAPADSEIVLEGKFTGEMASEGPFVDITSTWDEIREQPVLEITRIAFRKNPIYHALLPGKAEHRMLMGMPKEIDIYNEVNKECKCLDVNITPGGCAWLHAVIKIKKQRDSDATKAIRAAFRAHKSLKHCVVVDEDIDIKEPLSVEWAIATRFQAASDLIVLNEQPSSSLDPSAIHRQGMKSTGSKMGIDATIKKSGNKVAMFKRVSD